MPQLFKNNSESTLAVAINLADVVPMNVQVAAGHGDRFPLIATIGADYFDITLESAAGLVEIFRIKQRTSGSDVLVVDSRARESTTAKSWSTSPATIVGLRLTAAAIDAVLAHPAVTTAAHAATSISNTPAGNVVALTMQAAINELDAEKQSTVTGAATTITAANLTVSRALVSDASGKVAVSSVTSVELGYLSGVTSAVQPQLNAKQASDPTLTALAGLATGADRLPYSTGADVFAQATFTAFARTVLDDVDAATARATLGIRAFTSAEQAITAAGTLTIAHGLVVIPLVVNTYIVCQTAEAGYSIGDRLQVNPSTSNSTVVDRGHSIVFDTTNFVVRFSDAATCYSIINKTTGALTATTNANWRLVISAIGI